MARKERQAQIFGGGVEVTSEGGTGLGLINSGDTSTTVSHALITSGQPILLTPRVVNPGTTAVVASGQPFNLVVNSIVEGVSMAVATINAEATIQPVGFSYWIVNTL